ncbi:MAG: hypothetical protein WD185_10170, partial [Sneathiella sp.]
KAWTRAGVRVSVSVKLTIAVAPAPSVDGWLRPPPILTTVAPAEKTALAEETVTVAGPPAGCERFIRHVTVNEAAPITGSVRDAGVGVTLFTSAKLTEGARKISATRASLIPEKNRRLNP